MARTRFLLNPTFSIETGELLSHDGESFEEPVLLFDRKVQGQANEQRKSATSVGDTAGTNAAQEGGVLRPTLEQRATHPEGYAPTDINNMLVKQQESAGGTNATLTGEGRLAAMRGRNAGGFAPALAEAARSKGRTLATGALDVATQNAQLKQAQQQQALQQLQGMYGTDTSDQLKAMGLANQDLESELAAGRQGWQQNAMGWLNALKPKGSVGGMSIGG